MTVNPLHLIGEMEEFAAFITAPVHHCPLPKEEQLRVSEALSSYPNISPEECRNWRALHKIHTCALTSDELTIMTQGMREDPEVHDDSYAYWRTLHHLKPDMEPR